MATKIDLVNEIIAEFNAAQIAGLKPPSPGRATRFPPMIGTGDGTHFAATDRLLACISQFADFTQSADPSVRAAYLEKDFRTVVERSFAQAIQKAFAQNGKPVDANELLETVEALIGEEIGRRRRSLKLVLGCSLIRELAAYPIAVGPATFQTREQWLVERENSGEVSMTTAKRLRRAWSGSRLRKRKSSWDEHNEESISNALGPNEVVCTVTTNGLTQNAAREKGIQCARLAMTAVALIWSHPQGALEWMHLKYDGERYLRQFALLTPNRRFIASGSSTSKLPGGIYADASVTTSISGFQPILDVLGTALSMYVDADDITASPDVKNAIFLALWWYHQGCREQSDQMAVVAFAASLDALAAGGKAKGIKELIESRLGTAPNQKLMSDGRTSNEVVDRIYNAGRSRFLHGSSVDYRDDWSRLRGSAEAVGRQCLVQVCSWVDRNPSVTDPKALRSA